MKIEAKVTKTEDGYEVSAKCDEPNICVSSRIRDIELVKNPNLIEMLKNVVINELKEALKKKGIGV